MKLKLGLGVALLTACSGGSGQGGQRREPARAEAARAAAARSAAEPSEVAGGETSEFSGDIGSCPEIVSSEPLDLEDPEVASWVALAQGHHELSLGWRRLVLSDEVTGFAEHTSVSIDVNVLRGRLVMYGGGGSTEPEIAGCKGQGARQLELEIALATADGAAATTFRNWFQPLPSDLPGGIVLARGILNPDNDTDGADVHGTLELGLDPALGGTPTLGVWIEFSAGSLQGTLSAGLAPELSPEGDLRTHSNWTPIEAIFPDEVCGSGGRMIGLDEYSADINGTPRAYYQRVAAAWEREPIPAVWKTPRSGVELSPPDLPPPTQVSLDAGEPTRACDSGGVVTVYAPLTITTADGRVHLTQPFGSHLVGSLGAYVYDLTPWVPAADFDEHMGVHGVNMPSGYGRIYLDNGVDWREARVAGSLEVSQWDAFTDRAAAYPLLEWCSGRCISDAE